ncbi:hypothetical protein FRC02_008968 [Tulasnella sp. 418]|nr:hypothetical protein FRC02_008968 [Tulasnella sp. 418]
MIPPNPGEPVIKPEPVEHRVLTDRNTHNSVSTAPLVKPEPVNVSPSRLLSTLESNALTPSRARARENSGTTTSNKSGIKSEPVDNVTGTSRSFPVPPAPYVKYNSHQEIIYTPEGALSAGSAMIKVVKEKVRHLEIGSKLRKDVWKKDLDKLSNATSPATLIAICGATGAGKSSVINALLNDTIVPTSGMRACTAVVTEISYKTGRSIEGDVAFLAHDEWKAELSVLLDDLVDENGNLRPQSSLRAEAAVAWQKVHAVYPNIPYDSLINLKPELIISKDPKIARMLGTTQKISCANSKAFGKEIAKYIDSKEKKRGKKDKKDKDKKDKSEGPAYWPLVKTVKVRCPADALSTGAVLVDLPGTADANAARSSIAQQYMQQCHCIWILAPITRAVDDKVAKDLLGQAFKTQLLMDGNYDTSTVTFVATKTDDLSCKEIISALGLENDEELDEIQSSLAEYNSEMKKQTKIESEAKKAWKAEGEKLKAKRVELLEHKAHLKALKEGETFQSTLSKSPNSKSGKKRKRSGDNGDSPKRRKIGSDSDDDESEESDDDLHMLSDPDDAPSDSDKGSDDEKSDQSGSDDEYREDDNDDDEDDEGKDKDEDEDDNDVDGELMTEETMQEIVKQDQAELNEIKQSLQEAKDRHKEAQTAISKLKKKIAKAQREKNGYCAKARNEYSRDSLKEDWRAGVREMDQEAAMERDAANFDPTFDMRDYAAIDLPTFTVSSRDYIRITKQVEGDGEPTCFTDVADTQIPALQEWTKSLTVSSRDRAARNFLTQLKTFTAGIESYLCDMNSVSAIDRVNLRQRWASDLEGQSERMSTPPLRDFYDGSDDENSQEIELANPNGVVGTLNQAFREIVDAIVGDLQNVFKVGLQEKMQIGSRNAAAAAVQTSDTFAAEMHWSTYRATLRRDGIFRRDLNAELSQPLTNSIANSWAKVFEQDLFSAFEQRAKDAVVMMIDKIEASAATGLKDRCRAQGALALEDANTTMKGIVTLVNETLQTKQKDVSRTLSPHIQLQLQESYALAMLERGIGSVARQKAVVHNEIKRLRNQLFQGASDLLMDGLSSAAEAVGDALHSSLWDLANKVEVAMSVLWEDVKSSKAQIEYRAAVVKEVQEVAQQIRLWVAAEQSRQH